MAERKIVELRTAYHWWCETCGVENFSLPQKAELTDEQAEYAYRQLHGMDDYDELPDRWREFEIVCIPDDVECRDCHTTFATIDERGIDG